MESKNKEWADSFHAFCMEHPELRFWQALLAWGKQNVDPLMGYIYTAPSKDMFEVEDTFYKDTYHIDKEDC